MESTIEQDVQMGEQLMYAGQYSGYNRGVDGDGHQSDGDYFDDNYAGDEQGFEGADDEYYEGQYAFE